MTFDPIEFEKIDILERMYSRLLLQFQDAPVLKDILQAFGWELDALLSAVEEVVVERGPADAIKVQLESLGRIVGQSRVSIDQSVLAWLSTDVPGETIDRSPAWVTNVPVLTFLFANDDIYRQLIEARIYRNFTQYGSIPENQRVALLAFDLNVSFRRIGPMIVDIQVPRDTSRTTIAIILGVLYSQEGIVDIMPYPPTLGMDSFWIIPGLPGCPECPECPFAPDTACGPDIGILAVRQDIIIV